MAIDLIFLIVAGYGFILGFSRGIIRTVFTFLSILFGLMSAFRFAPAMTNFLKDIFTTSNPLMFIAGFLLAFVVTMMLIRFFARILEGFLETANINFINQLAGGVLLSSVMILIFSMLLWFGDEARLIDRYTKEQSVTYPYLEEFPSSVWTVGEQLKPTFEEFWQYSVQFMIELERMTLERTETNPTIYDIPDDTEEDGTDSR